MRVGRFKLSWIGLIVAVVGAVLALAACSGDDGAVEPRPFTSLGPPPGKVQLLVTKIDEGTVAMRSPTFR